MSDERELREALEQAQSRVKELESELQTLRAELAKPRAPTDAEFLELTAELHRLRVLKAPSAPQSTRRAAQGAAEEARAQVHRFGKTKGAAEPSPNESRDPGAAFENERLGLLAEIARLESGMERAARAERERDQLLAEVQRLKASQQAPATNSTRRTRPARSNYANAMEAGELATLKYERDELKAKLKQLTDERDQLRRRS